MKKALLVYQTNKDTNYFNIGDYIQSLAAAQYFDKIDLYLNREHLNEYKGEDVEIIMNGWFLHEPINWPPSKKIYPFYVAFHLNLLAKDILNNSQAIEHFKRFSPIGCRDYNTVNYLNEKGIDAYFSGCLTLTLCKTYLSRQRRNDYIYFVDPYVRIPKSKYQIIFQFIKNISKYKILKKLSLKMRSNFSLKSLLFSSCFYYDYSALFSDEVLLNAKYLKHEILDTFKDDDSKFKYAEELLNYYSNARFVVTSRIHCALPCLSLETPVIYTENDDDLEVSSCRLNGLKQLFHRFVLSSDKSKFQCSLNLNSKIGINTKWKNKEDYKMLRDSLIKTCSEFDKEKNK